VEQPAILFGPYRLLAAERLMLEGDKPVRLGSRAFDILTTLVERAGKVVGKEELIARAWPNTSVEEANLKMQVSALRRALGQGQDNNRYVATIVGRGYNFVAPIRKEESTRASPSATIAPAAPHNLPFTTTRVIGLEEIVTTLVAKIPHRRLLTIVGPGGIGKTTLALAVAERMIGAYEHGTRLVDLAPLRDPRLVPSAVATVLGLEIHSEDPLVALVAALRDRRMLLLLDSCEHVVEAAADLAAAVIGGAPGVRILATSREPLRVAGESRYRLRPLGIPQPSSTLTAVEAQRFSAVQLFIERATAVVEDFKLTDETAQRVVEICRRLDGLPLAIEFAAPRVAVLGIEGLAARLDDRLSLLSTRQRITSPRHQTMRAVIDWSHGLLSDSEQRLFQAVGVFSGNFTTDAATAVAVDEGDTQIDILDRLADLVAKSLVVADTSGTKPTFRLFDTTRAYAIEKLNESDRHDRIARRHAEYYCNLFGRGESEALTRPAAEWLADYAREIDNLRAALDWAFSPGGDVSAGTALTAAAIPLWLYLSLNEECRHRVERALADPAAATADARIEMKLQAALAISLGQAVVIGTKTEEAWTRTLRLAESLSDVDYQLRALFGLWQVCDKEALALAERFAGLASTPSDRLIADQMMGHSHHIQGDQGRARRHLERVAASHVASIDSERRIIRFDVDEQPTIFLSRVLWLQGLPRQAMAMAAQSVEHAKADAHAKSLCFALAFAACPIALWAGNLDLAEQYISLLHDISSRHELTLWHSLGRAHRGVLVVRRGDLEGGLSHLRAAFEECRVAPTGYRVLFFVAEMIEALGRAGQTPEALVAAQDALDRAERTAEGWIVAELLRIKGELLRLGRAPGAGAAAEACFRDALQMARMQGALAWELRAAMSLTRLLRDQCRHADGVAVLQPVYARFADGLATTDLRTAQALLDEFWGTAC
jgi:predicted ATPase/DNA-binding winged helix-turn-helix (wHTH) protein